MINSTFQEDNALFIYSRNYRCECSDPGPRADDHVELCVDGTGRAGVGLGPVGNTAHTYHTSGQLDRNEGISAQQQEARLATSANHSCRSCHGTGYQPIGSSHPWVDGSAGWTGARIVTVIEG